MTARANIGPCREKAQLIACARHRKYRSHFHKPTNPGDEFFAGRQNEARKEQDVESYAQKEESGTSQKRNMLRGLFNVMREEAALVHAREARAGN